MCEPDLNPRLAPGTRCWRSSAMLPRRGSLLSSFRLPAPSSVRLRGRDAGRCWRRGLSSLHPSPLRAVWQLLVMQRCPAWIGRVSGGCARPTTPLLSCQPCRALPSSAPGNVQRCLLAFLEGLNSTFSSSRLSLLLPYRGTLPLVQLLLSLPLCLRAIPLKGCCSCSTEPVHWLTWSGMKAGGYRRGTGEL